MTQLSKTTSTCETQWKMLLLQVFTLIYLTSVCAAQDGTAISSLGGTTSVPPTTYNPPEAFLQLTSAFSEVFTSEKVVLKCSISSSSGWTFIWEKDGKQLSQNADISFHDSELTITANSIDLSGQYTCRGKEQGKGRSSKISQPIEVRVNANIPKLTISRSPNFDRFYPGELISFTCKVDVTSAWNYQWYKDGAQITDANSNTYEIASLKPSDKGQYHCKVQRGKGPLYESNKESVQVAEPPIPILSLETPWSDVFLTEVLKFSCTVPSADWTLTWYKDQKDLSKEGPSLEIPSVKQNDGGEYTCKARLKSRGVTSGSSDPKVITVQDNKPKPVLTRSPDFSLMYPGESIIFTCTVDMYSGWEYEWYHKGVKQQSSSSKTFTVGSLTLGGSGEYRCLAKRGQLRTDQSDPVSLQVSDPPKPILKLLSPWSDVFQNEVLKFSCEVSSSEWTVTWHRNQILIPNENGLVLNIAAAKVSDGGEYSCKAHQKHRGVSSAFSNTSTVSVYDSLPTPTSNIDLSFSPMYIGETVKLKCTVSVSSGWSYHWYKDGKELNKPGKELNIQLTLSDNGGYTCEARRGEKTSTGRSKETQLDVREIPVPLLSKKTQWLDVFPSESVQLSCRMEGSSNWTFIWYKDSEEYHEGNVTNSEVEGILSISQASSSHRGKYSCSGRLTGRTVSSNRSSQVELTVYDSLPTPTLSRDPIFTPMFIGETVKLKCTVSVSSGWSYHWYRDGKELNKPGKELNIQLTLFDNGGYTCEAKRGEKTLTGRSKETQLDVRDGKPTVKLLQNPSDKLMHTSDSISFTCHVNVSSGWKYAWYKDSNPLKSSGNNIHQIASAKTSDSGSYKCRVERQTPTTFSSESEAVELKIDERPKANIVLLTSWSEVFSTDSLKLQCDVMDSSDSWNYTWHKEGINVSQSPSSIYKVTPHNDPEQSSYTCEGIRTERPLFSVRSDSYRTKNLLLKRRILLSISGCLFFGIIAVFIGCVALRICRKPVAADDKQEETNLFLTMAQLKDRNDAPCPLVEYITDADVNPPAKEGEENGTSCSEATPLPITSPDEQAATTNGKETTENGGGMVSFLQ
ncbi:titin isoform X1 [Poecilia reticulata]|uniref:Basement membrane-specific heparan sulfate proteoglycan core protein-like n=1 Tax=Poecilia reticulata TaxID=8081 RepID=A0A3P9Q5Y0_POERE|nr:PREDICTED: titin-like isoform X1 [Poecilia reticulata]